MLLGVRELGNGSKFRKTVLFLGKHLFLGNLGIVHKKMSGFPWNSPLVLNGGILEGMKATLVDELPSYAPQCDSLGLFIFFMSLPSAMFYYLLSPHINSKPLCCHMPHNLWIMLDSRAWDQS